MTVQVQGSRYLMRFDLREDTEDIILKGVVSRKKTVNSEFRNCVAAIEGTG